jgi:hypothetical protein
MEFDANKALEEVGFLLKKCFGILLLLIGATGGLIRMRMDDKLAHTNGQKFLVVFVGGLLSYLIGGVAKSADISHEIISLIGFVSGFIGYSVMKYIIDNEQAIFHNASNFIARLCDVVLEQISSWFESWKGWFKSKKEKSESKPL